MIPGSVNSKIWRLGFTLQRSYCLVLNSWVPIGPVSSSGTVDKGTFLPGFLSKSMCEECLAQGQACSKSIYRGCHYR